jgi:hypothetical protein
VPVGPLTHELNAQRTRVPSPRVFLTAGVGVAVPDHGLQAGRRT